MKAYLIRHADAVDKATDPDRPLSDGGREELRRIMEFLKGRPLDASQVWHSGKLRALQTAEALLPCLGASPSLSENEDLKPNGPPKSVRSALEKAGQNVAIVGHLPHLSLLAGLLLTGDNDAEPVMFDRGAVVALELDAEAGWQIEWMVTPRLLGG